ncbi:hypothetical protein Rsub_10700 [Raphidocelis subcapitata]|uniref:CW-type domain-containing protein n=1 Tax=Raphidocelis subcapitata TaxID=307507 RepID=A0A2V0PJW9_9CHLO|nr:hypothetical protein Rsub_10700 [Raphidocelis subcapitata]|eukprot:GBF98200.1 hypothetical protein Rsub_10700 [Raphidocelis subcapitata]
MALDLSTYAAPLLVSGTSGKVLELGARVAYAPDLRGADAKRRFGRGSLEATAAAGAGDDAAPAKAAAPPKAAAGAPAGAGAPPSKPKPAVPNVTIKDLIDAGLIRPGPDAVTVSYKNSATQGELLPDGTIVYGGTKFATASAFSVHVKRLQTPSKQGDDGWRSVHAAGSGLSLHDLRLRLLQAAAAGGVGGGAAAAPKPRGRPRGRPLTYQEPDEDEEEEEEPQPAAAAEPVEVHWVQCSRCERWRVVPDAHWGPIAAADEDADWFCRDAVWDLRAHEPFEPACEGA